jgi:membrane protein DedA with SNARE-associated domain
MTFFQHAAADIEHAIVLYGAVALFVVIFFESFGAPLPGESALIAASLLASRGDLSLGHVFLAAFLGGLLGDSTGFLIGRFGGRKLLVRYGPLVKLTPERLARVERLAQTRGFLMVLGARFVVVLRQLNGLVAGSAGMPWHHFVVANAVGSALWAGLWTLGPYYFTDLFRRFL